MLKSNSKMDNDWNCSLLITVLILNIYYFFITLDNNEFKMKPT